MEGVLKENKGEIIGNIARKENSILERCISDEGVYAKTNYEVLKTIESENLKATVVKLRLETGRTHQIRVHMKYIGHPLIGDFLYGQKSDLIERQALHSWKVEFIHPILKEKMYFEARVPRDMERLIKNEGEFYL